jgi:hypothetical protein
VPLWLVAVSVEVGRHNWASARALLDKAKTKLTVLLQVKQQKQDKLAVGVVDPSQSKLQSVTVEGLDRLWWASVQLELQAEAVRVGLPLRTDQATAVNYYLTNTLMAGDTDSTMHEMKAAAGQVGPSSSLVSSGELIRLTSPLHAD